MSWDYLSKDTIGKQLIRSIDSVAANLSEGYGRYRLKEARLFAYYSRGSLSESLTWINNTHNRKLISDLEYDNLRQDIKNLGIRFNNYGNTIGKVNKYQRDPPEAGTAANEHRMTIE